MLFISGSLESPLINGWFRLFALKFWEGLTRSRVSARMGGMSPYAARQLCLQNVMNTRFYISGVLFLFPYQFAGDVTQATSTVLQTVASTIPPISTTSPNNTLVTTSTGNLATRATFLCFFIVLGKNKDLFVFVRYRIFNLG